MIDFAVEPMKVLKCIFSRVHATINHTVGLSVRTPNTKTSRIGKAVSALESVSNVAAPAQTHATDAAVYMALLCEGTHF